MIVEIEISNITLPQGLLPRVLTGTIQEKVEEYKEAYQQGEDMPPIAVWKKDNQYWIVDGVHRFEAQKLLGKNTVKAKILDLKNELEYRKEAIRLNKHGIPLKKEEKELLAKTLFKSGLNITELCKLFSVSERTIYRWIDELINEKEIKRLELINKAKELKEQGFTQDEIAEELNISQQAVSNWLNLPTFDKMSNFGKSNNFNSIYAPQPFTNTESEEELISDDIGKDLSRYVIEDELEETEELLQAKEKKSKGGRPISRIEKLAPFDAEKQLEILYGRVQAEMYRIAGIWGHKKAIEVLYRLIDDVNEDWEGHPGTGHPKAVLPEHRRR
ncbi:MAG: helix-turn-helix domain-containing protein [Candidatus Dojkabacteria bacterium]|nr:helix-turn-helix domain-containing protein [Candidatus Dojkabacteria bacterium]